MISLQYTTFLLLVAFATSSLKGEDRIPFYEDYLKNSELEEFLDKAKDFLEKSSDSPEAPRVAMDYLMIGKAASRPEAVDKATSLLLFRYPKSLPGLQFISSFDLGSPRLTNLLISKVNQADLQDKEFAVSFCRTLLFIARIQGPDLLKNPSLRLRAFLLGQIAEVDEITEAARPSLEKLAQKKDAIGEIAKVILAETSNFQKIESLSKISSLDANFCLKFYISQLDETESKSEKMVIFKVNQTLFAKDPDTNLARELIASLEAKTQNTPRIQVLLAFSHHLDENTDLAITGLTNSSKLEAIPQNWKNTLESYAEGLSSNENRKKLFTDSLGEAITILQNGGECFFAKANWKSDEDNNKTSTEYNLLIGISKEKKEFEIHLQKDGNHYLAYRSGPESSKLLLPSNQKIIHFKESGALPLAKISINRDTNSGFFNYNFNLSFGPSFEDFIDASSSLLENPYFSTLKGREVLWNYVLQRKLIWHAPPSSASASTTFPILSISKDQTGPRTTEFSFGLEGNIESFRSGKFKISELELGDGTLMNSLPDWPNLPIEKIDKFDVSKFMKIVNEISLLALE